MEFKLSRLRSGEWLVAVSTVVLLVVLVALPWYGYASDEHISVTITGWQEFTHLRWLLVLTIAGGLALVVSQAACRAPAIPVTLDVILVVLAALTSLWLIYRVLIQVPGSDGLLVQKPAAYVGLASALALTIGAFRSLRTEDPPDLARNAAIPTIELDHGA